MAERHCAFCFGAAPRLQGCEKRTSSCASEVCPSGRRRPRDVYARPAWRVGSTQWRGAFCGQSRLGVSHAPRARRQMFDVWTMNAAPLPPPPPPEDDDETGNAQNADGADASELGKGEPSSDVPNSAYMQLDMDSLRKRMLQVREVEHKRDLRDSVSSSTGEDEDEDEDDDDGFGTEYTLEYDTEIHIGDLTKSHGDVDEDSMRRLNDEFEKLDKLFVILFNSKSDSEGVYSLALDGVNIVLAFQEKTEARRYALMLEAQDFPSPHVGEFSANELKTFCGEAGYRLGLVPKGSLMTPPEGGIDGNMDDWSSDKKSGTTPRSGEEENTLDPEEMELMKKRLESLFGES